MSRSDQQSTGDDLTFHEVETLPRERLRELQSDRLQETVERAYENVEFYRRRLDEHGVSPDEITSIDDISKLPFTRKEHFHDTYPYGLFAVPLERVRRVHASSGTTGNPKVVGYTENDIQVWRDVMARSLHTAGVRPGDTFQNSYGYGLFTGGMGFHEGVEGLGAMVIPIGGGNTGRQIKMLRDLETDAMGCTPSYCLYLAEEIENRGVDPESLPLSTVVIGAEPFTDPMREEIEDALDVTAIDIYGLSELIGPGVSIECAEMQDGMHVWEDHFYPEVVDPDTGEPVEPGERGELVLTSLTKEALPVLRYRTGDVTRLHSDECDCGRTSVRMENISGRVDDLLIVRGVNVYASSIEEVIVEMEEIAPHYRIDLHRDGHLDTMELTVEHHEGFSGDTNELEERIGRELKEILDITVDGVNVVRPTEVGRSTSGKVQRVYDHRAV